MYYYAFTSRLLTGSIKDKVTSPESWIVEIRKKYPHLDIRYHYEYVLNSQREGNHNVHIHGMISTPRKVLYKLIHPGPNYHFWIEAVKTVAAWNVYITKNNINSSEECYDNIMYDLENESQENNSVSSVEDETLTKTLLKIGAKKLTRTSSELASG